MASKRENEIQSLRNIIKANEYTMKKYEGFDDLKFDNDKMKEQIATLEKPQVKIKKEAVEFTGEIQDSGDNCLAVQKNGKQCGCQRKYGNYCKRHLAHYIEEKEDVKIDFDNLEMDLAVFIDSEVYLPVKEELAGKGITHSLGRRKESLKGKIAEVLQEIKEGYEQ